MLREEIDRRYLSAEWWPNLVTSLAVELASILCMPHPVIHIYVRQTVEQELNLCDDDDESQSVCIIHSIRG